MAPNMQTLILTHLRVLTITAFKRLRTITLWCTTSNSTVYRVTPTLRALLTTITLYCPSPSSWISTSAHRSSNKTSASINFKTNHLTLKSSWSLRLIRITTWSRNWIKKTRRIKSCWPWIEISLSTTNVLTLCIWSPDRPLKSSPASWTSNCRCQKRSSKRNSPKRTPSTNSLLRCSK